MVHEHIENPYGYQPPKLSDALDLTFDGQRTWIIVELKKDGFGSTSAPSPATAGRASPTTSPTRSDGATAGDDGWPDTLRLTDDGTVVADARAARSSSAPTTRSSATPSPRPAPRPGPPWCGVAEDGVGYFVVWRVIDGELDVITTPPNDVVGATFQELLSYARGQYANGEGLR